MVATPVAISAPPKITSTATDEPPDEELQVTPTRTVPLHVESGFEIDGWDDGSTYRGEDARLCRCGGSSDEPFCDGLFAMIGFTTGDD